MQLTRFTDLSLRVLMYMAWQPAGASANVKSMARAFAVPENHLVKVVHFLGRQGLLKTTRGRGGGVRLGRPPGEIRVGEVVRLTEPGLDLVDCDAPTPCPLRATCGLKGVLDDAAGAFLHRLDVTTLAELIPQSNPNQAPERELSPLRMAVEA